MPKSIILELEQKINNSPFFHAFGENMEAVRDREKAKLVLNLWKLSQQYWPKNRFNDQNEYLSVINDTILRCMERFEPGKGIFTNFFKNQVKFAIRNWIKKEREKGKQEKKYIKATKDSCLTQDHAYDMLENQESHHQMSAYLEIIEQAFLGKQERVKPWLCTLWTRKCFNFLAGTKLPEKRYTWIDYEFLEKYRKTKKIPNQREIAALYGRVEQDASRAIRQFRDLVASQIKNNKK